MPIDPRQLRPTELVRLLNSTPLGEVLSERQLLRHRSRAGFRIGDDRHVDLFRYVAWLAAVRHEPQPETDGDPYGSLKERARARNAALSLAGRDIGELPAVVNPERKTRAATNFRSFCEAYFPFTFHLAWSPDHLKVIAKIERAVLEGGLFAMAMPRGSGKTSICECACIWAVLNGHRDFVCLIGSDEGHAMDMLESIKTELDSNDLLLEDFPEVVYPIQCLDGIANRCSGQLYQGERTHIGWTAREVVLPTITGSKAMRRHHQGRRHYGAHPRHEVQAGRRPLGAAVVGGVGRSADRRVRPQHFAVRHAGEHPGRRRVGAGWPRQEDRRRDALYGHSPRRHGRQNPRPRQARTVAGGTDQDGLLVPDQRNAVGQVCGDPGREPASRARAGRRHGVLWPTSGGNGRGGGCCLA